MTHEDALRLCLAWVSASSVEDAAADLRISPKKLLKEAKKLHDMGVVLRGRMTCPFMPIDTIPSLTKDQIDENFGFSFSRPENPESN